MRFAFIALLMLVCGCEVLQEIAVDVCVDYKGQHVCVGRTNGNWTFTADLRPLTISEENEIILSLGGNR